MTRERGRTLAYTAGCVAALAWLYASSRIPAAFGLSAGLAVGFVLSLSGFCFVSAMTNPMIAPASRTSNIMLWTIAGLTVAYWGLGRLGVGHSVEALAPAHLLTPVGGFLFGTGMVLAGTCILGTMVRLGEGKAPYLLALLGMLMGLPLGQYLRESIGRGAVVHLPTMVGPGAGLAIQGALLLAVFLGIRHLCSMHLKGGR